MKLDKESNGNSAGESSFSAVVHQAELDASSGNPLCQPDRDGSRLVLPNLRIRGRNANLIGSVLGRLRYERALTQDMLAARLQIQGCEITRDIIYNIEARRSVVTDKQLVHLARVFKLRICDLFPADVRKNDEELLRTQHLSNVD